MLLMATNHVCSNTRADLPPDVYALNVLNHSASCVDESVIRYVNESYCTLITVGHTQYCVFILGGVIRP